MSAPSPSTRHDVVIVGAGPHGLAAAAYLRALGADVAIFGEPLSFWRHHMPRGMLLRSSANASSIANPGRRRTLKRWAEHQGRELLYPFPIEDWIDYATWFQRAVAPDADPRSVTGLERRGGRFRITLADGEIESDRVIIAAGIAPFARFPDPARGLPESLVSHSVDHPNLSRIGRGRVAVLGAGQSALESAALLHEAGAEVELIGRADGVLWLGTISNGGSVPMARIAQIRAIGARMPVPYPPTEVGGRSTGWVSAFPDVFRRLPSASQAYATQYALRPAGAHWLLPRLKHVKMTTGVRVERAERVGDRLGLRLSDGTERSVDHLLLGTGYDVDIARYPFLSGQLLEQIERIGGQPVLRTGMESSVPGLYFVGAPAALSFGPVMRFVVGSWYAAPAVARHITGRRQPPLARSY
jgi:cation diffusion facilitator CzcD-associated flavoprotein CzcO